MPCSARRSITIRSARDEQEILGNLATGERITILKNAGYDVDHVQSIDWCDVGNGSDYFFFHKR